MSLGSKIQLEVVDGPCKGERFKLGNRDSFMVGRGSDCCQVIRGDRTLSRHHMMIEVNRSDVLLRDLGSRNGTFINGKRIGGKQGPGGPENAQESDPVRLRDRDRIQAGQNTLLMHLQTTPICVDCGCEIPESERRAAEFINGTYMCSRCREEDDLLVSPPKTRERAAGATARARAKRGGGRSQVSPRMSVVQRRKAERSPAAVVDELLKKVFNVDEADAGALPEIGGYRILKELGRGGFGVVYKSQRQTDGQTVAVKTMLQTRNSAEGDVGLFKREQEIALQLKHSNIVATYDCGEWGDVHYMEMEYVPDGSVLDLMKRCPEKRLTFKMATPIMLDVLEGLAYAHQARVTVTTRKGQKTTKGVVHRDMKPANILLVKKDGKYSAKISDYGLAKAFSLAGLTQGRLTMQNVWKGTVFYMAREHVVNYQYVEPVTDVFETAATFFHMLTGHGVWPLGGSRRPHKVILEAKPRHLKDYVTGIPSSVQKVFDRALKPDPGKRIATGAQFLEELKRAL